MAQLQNIQISDTGFLNLPAGTTGQRPGSPVAGQIRYNTTLNITEYYDGAVWRPISDTSAEATGGTVVDTEIGGVPYRVHLFTTVGNSTFTVTKGGEVEYLIVAGGGGGGGWGGGGGAGGFLTGFTRLTPQAYTITVGGGGTRGTSAYSSGGDGANSSAFGFTSIGGGGGGHYSGNTGRSGGSGGGGGILESDTTGFGSVAGVGTAGQGNNGGRGRARPGSVYWGGGGGGGAGSPGEDAPLGGRGGNGGTGLSSNMLGSNIFYAGGGGGHSPGQESTTSTIFSRGGLGGGGDGGRHNYFVGKNARDGAPNTGGGGGGAHGDSGTIGTGGSGIVIVRYRRNTTIAASPTPAVFRRRNLPLLPAQSGLFPESAAPSGHQLALSNPSLPSGYYWIQSNRMQNPLLMYVDMEQEGGGFDFFPITGSGISIGTVTNAHSGTPLGLDLVYPRSKAHWFAMSNFVRNVLGDGSNQYFTTAYAVYRETSAGGGSRGGNYTSEIMRNPAFYGTGTPDWRVPDGGRWWLRDTTFGEPNGDYTAGNFLGGYTHPNPYTGQDIQFNDVTPQNYVTGGFYLVSTNAKP